MDRRSEKPEPGGATLSVLGLMVWVAGLSAVAGLVGEVIRMARVEASGGQVGGFLVVYIVYLSLSVPLFWKAPALATPTTMLVGGILWTLALQLVGRQNLAVALMVLPILPVLTALIVRMIFRRAVDAEDREAKPDRPSTVRSLLRRKRGFGPRRAPVGATTEPEP